MPTLEPYSSENNAHTININNNIANMFKIKIINIINDNDLTVDCPWRHFLPACAYILGSYCFCNVAHDLMEGSGIMKSSGEMIQNQLLFEGLGIMKSSGDRNKK